jgi:uncharacterized protein (DUF1697 family)
VSRYVAFLRAINVGGRSLVKMTDLQRAFAVAGCKGARTFIQSGNVVFDVSDKDPEAVFQRIRSRIRKLMGTEPEVLFRSIRQLERIVKSSPFGRLVDEPLIKLNVVFLSGRPKKKPKLPSISVSERLEVVAIRNLEVFLASRRKESGFYGFPNNFVEKELGVAATSRNLSTVTKIVEFARRT